MDTLLVVGLVNFLLATALAILVYGLSRICRRPALLHSLWVLVLLKLVAPPLILLPVLDPIEKPVAKRRVPATRSVMVVSNEVVPDAGFIQDNRIETNVEPAKPPLPARVVLRAVPLRQPVVRTSVDFIEEPGEESFEQEPLATTAFPWVESVAGLWLAGAVFCLGWTFWGLVRFHRLLRHGERAPEALQAETRRLAAAMGLNRCPEVWLLPGPLPPLIWAAFGRARLYFPRNLLGRLNDEGRASLLAHELAHVCRRDHWVRWLEIIAVALYWWCPLAWCARAQLRVCEEECCDAWVVDHLSARAYAGAILEAVDFLATPVAVPAAASGLGRVEALKKRLVAIMERRHPRNMPRTGKLVVLLLACALPVLPTRAQPQDKKAETQPARAEEIKPALPLPANEPTHFENIGINLLGGDNDVWSVATSLDGRYLAAGLGWWDRPGEVRLISLARGLTLFSLPEKLGICSVAFSPDGKLLASAGWDHRVRIRQVPTGREEKTIVVDSTARLAFSPDSKWLATATESKKLQLWDSTTGALVRSFEGDLVRFHTVAFSPDGSQLAVGGGDWNEGGIRHVLIFDTKSGKQLRKITHPQPVLILAYSPDGKTLATGGLDGEVRLWDTASGRLRSKMTQPAGDLTGQARWLEGLSFSPDGKTVVSSCHDGSVAFWDAEMGMLKGTLPEGLGRTRTVCFTRDGKALITGSMERTIRLWDVTTRRETATLLRGSRRNGAGPILALAGSPDSKLIAVAQDDWTVQLRDAHTGEARSKLRGHEESVTCLVFSPDGKSIATGSPDRTVRIWDVETGKHRRTLEGHTSWVYTLAWSSDGKTLASSGYDRTIRLWDASNDFRELTTLKGHTASVRALAFSADGLRLASGGSDRAVRVWDLKKGEATLVLKEHEGTIRGVAFSPDGKTVASACEDGATRIWDTSTGRVLTTMKGHKGEVWSVSYPPGGKAIVTGGADGTVRVWDPATGQQRSLLTGHTEGITGLFLAPDGRTMLTGGLEGSIRRWEAARPPPNKKASLRIGNDVWFAMLVPDDQPIALVKKDGTLHMWTILGKRIALVRETLP
jgi:WD40 repeat protein/beta-lactamase regulating signal transducer with metallopeptidase domain